MTLRWVTHYCSRSDYMFGRLDTPMALALLIALCRPIQTHAYWDEYKYLDLHLNNQDHEFMADVQHRAGTWIKKTRAHVYEGFRKPLTSDDVRYKDSLLASPTDSWRLEVLLSRSYDTLTVLALTRNVQYFFATSEYDPYDGGFKLEPLYSLPLSEYHNFMSEEELGRLSTVVESALSQITHRILHVGSERVYSIEWQFSEHPDWQLLDPGAARATTSWCVSDRNITFYDLPSLQHPIGQWELASRVVHIDTTMVVGGVATAERILEPESIELIVHFEKLPRPTRPTDYLVGFVSYSLSNPVIGLRFGNAPDNVIWTRKEDFVTCYGDPRLEGWFDAIVANELEVSLQER